MMNISDKIQILRHDKEWSQDELAEKLNVSRQSVSKWESGKALPDSEKVLAMAKLFDVSTDFLLKDEQEPVFVDDEQEKQPVRRRRTPKRKSISFRAKRLLQSLLPHVLSLRR